jgi:hypothetical protein
MVQWLEGHGDTAMLMKRRSLGLLLQESGLQLLHLLQGQRSRDGRGHTTDGVRVARDDDLIADAGLALRELGKVLLGVATDL